MKSISFTGHRQISDPDTIKEKLNSTIDALILGGSTDFYVGGAVGFDTLAASAVISLRQIYPNIKLHLVLPCSRAEQTAKWSVAQIAEYDRIFSAADSAEFVSEHYYNGCMKARNARLIDYADMCICYYNKNKSACGTGQTVRMAELKGIPIINVAKQ